MYIHIDIETKKSLGLSIREAWMYSALLYLSKNGPYQGSYAELAELVDFENKMAVCRTINSLLNKNLITRTEKGLQASQYVTSQYVTSHNVTESSQYVTESSQYVTKSEKERSKEKEDNKRINNKCECVCSTHRTRAHESLEFEKKNILGCATHFIAPSNEEYFAYTDSIKMSRKSANKCLAFYKMNDWKGAQKNWKAAVAYWLYNDQDGR